MQEKVSLLTVRVCSRCSSELGARPPVMSKRSTNAAAKDQRFCKPNGLCLT